MDIVRKLNYVFSRKQKIKFILLFSIMFVGALLETIGISLILPFVSVVTDPHIIQKKSNFNYFYNLLNLKSANEFLLILCGALIIVYILKNLYLMFMYHSQYKFTFNNQMNMSVRLMDCYMHKPYTFHLQKNTAVIIRSITQDVSNLFGLVLAFILLISEILVALMLCVLLFLVDFYMTIFVIFLLLISMGIFLKIFKRRLKIYGEDMQYFSGQMIKCINQAFGGIKEIKVTNREDFFLDIYNKNGDRFIKATKKNMFAQQLPRLIIETICVCGILFFLLLVLYFGRDLSLIVPKIAIFAMAAFRLLPSVSRINSYVANIIYLKPSIDLIYNDLQNIEESNVMSKSKTQFNEVIKCIKIKNLSFKYPNTENYVFSNVNFEIPIGKSIAFIGASGSGKTTIADLIIGLLKPEKGTIKAEELNIHENVDIWSKKIGYIPQFIYLSDDSIRNNVAFGIKEELIDDNAVMTALKKAQIIDFVESQPNKLESIIGERGVKLSGGQRQRLGIARALYHNPEILILDEATSALDTDTENAVMDAIDNLRGRMTLIIIAHRLTTIKNCDVIFEVKDGKIEIKGE